MKTSAIIVLLLCAAGIVFGQDAGQYSQGTAPQHAAGLSKMGSYVSTELGIINLANGSMNMKLSIAEIGGRGFSIPLSINYSNKLWTVSQGTAIPPDAPIPQVAEKVAWAVFDDPDRMIDPYTDFLPGWTIGAAPTLKARGVGLFPRTNGTTGCSEFQEVFVKLTLVLPDKGEIEFRDDARNGEPSPTSANSQGCTVMDTTRGQTWHATDGSGAIFVGDSSNGVASGTLDGWVYTTDGMRYRFEGTTVFHGITQSAYLEALSHAIKIVDRQGNTINISYPNSTELDYTDQLARVTKIQFNVADPDNTSQTLALLVTLPGYQSTASRYIKLKKGVMNAHYRSDLSISTPVYTTNLFSSSWSGNVDEIDNKNVLTEFILPDGRELQFAYNQYGEVAEATVPTGGKIQYDYDHIANMPAGNSPAFENWVHGTYLGNSGAQDIDRGITARRVYNKNISDGSFNLESSWTYSYNPASGSVGAYTNVQAKDPSNNILLNQYHYFLTAGRYLTQYGGTGNTLWSTGVEYRTETRDASGNIMGAGEQDWSQRTAVVWSGYYTPTEQMVNDNRVNAARSILDDGKVSENDMTYDSLNNVTDVKEYDYGSGSPGSFMRLTHTDYVTSSTYLNAHLKRLPSQKWVSSDSGGRTKVAFSTFEFDNYTGDSRHASLVNRSSVSGFDSTDFGTGNTVRGNLTGATSYANAASQTGGVTVSSQYDILGNIVKTIDANGNATTIGYADNFGSPDNEATTNSAPSQLSGQSTFAFATNATNPMGWTAYTQYDYLSGALVNTQDINGVISKTKYDDPLCRPTQSVAAVGTSLEIQTTITYDDTDHKLQKTSDLNTLNDNYIKSVSYYDGFGRTTEADSYQADGNYRAIQTQYDALGRAYRQSNPFRPTEIDSGHPVLWTQSFFDGLGRVTGVQTPDSAQVTSSYSGSAVTVTDQAGKLRRSITNGSGQLVRVDEPDNSSSTGALGAVTSPNQHTDYSYDALNNLSTVSQGSQTRTFTYNSLSRLSSAANPESGTISYSYDSNGNLTSKVDARSITTSYSYDSLNRVSARSYSDGTTPSVAYTYDDTTISNSKGKLTKVNSSVSTTEYTSFDILGKVTGHKQTTDGTAYTTGYTYKLSGALDEETYPEMVLI